MKLSISEAARAAGISRQHFYTKYLNHGLISIDRETPDKPTIDTSELIRVFGNIQLPDSPVSAGSQELTQDLSRRITELDAELTATRQQLIAAQDRERWLHGTVDKLADTIKLLEHRGNAGPLPVDTAVVEAERSRVAELEAQLAAERSRGFLSRLFGGKR